MVNSCNSRSPILLDTPERPNGAAGNTTVIEIPDSSERSHSRRRRLESMDGVILADSPKRARVDVPVIDLTADNEEESSSADDNSDSLLITLENSPYYAEIVRGHYLSDHNRFRIRRALSLRHRPTSHHPRHEDRQSNVGSVSSRTDSGRSSHGLSNIRPENFEQTILVDDEDSPAGQSGLLDRASGFSRPSCSRVSPPRISTSDNTRPTLSPSARSERSRLPLPGSLHTQESHESDSERRSSRRDTSQQLRAVRRNQRRLREQSRQLRERLEYISPFTHFASNSHDNFGLTVQPPASQETGVHSGVYTRPNPNIETNPVRLNLRTSPPIERGPYADIPDLMLPALLSWWGPDSRLRHFGDVDDERDSDYEALWSLTERLGQVKPKGLSKGELDEIPSFRFSAASKDSSNGSCVVCMMNYSNREKLRRLPCNHDFHAKCIDKWLKNNRSCPVCRKDVTTK